MIGYPLKHLGDIGHILVLVTSWRAPPRRHVKMNFFAALAPPFAPPPLHWPGAAAGCGRLMARAPAPDTRHFQVLISSDYNPVIRGLGSLSLGRCLMARPLSPLGLFRLGPATGRFTTARNKKTAALPDNAFKLISAQVDKIDRIDYIFAVATPR